MADTARKVSSPREARRDTRPGTAANTDTKEATDTSPRTARKADTRVATRANINDHNTNLLTNSISFMHYIQVNMLGCDTRMLFEIFQLIYNQ